MTGPPAAQFPPFAEFLGEGDQDVAGGVLIGSGGLAGELEEHAGGVWVG